MSKDKITRIASVVIGLILAVVLVMFGIRILQNRSGRAEVKPDNVKVCDTNQNGFTVCFNARPGLEAKVDYDTECKEAANLFATCTAGSSINDGEEEYRCPITLATTETTYYFKIDVDGKTVDNSGTCFQARTIGTATSQSAGGVLTPQPTRPSAPPSATPLPNPAAKIEEIKAKFKDGLTLVQCVSQYSNSEYNASIECLNALNSLTPTP